MGTEDFDATEHIPTLITGIIGVHNSFFGKHDSGDGSADNGE